MLGGLSVSSVVVLAAVWALGLWVHSFVLTASLPGLGHRRALTLNLTGSAVANVVPLGGAFGVALNWAMVRSWRFRPLAFTRFTLVSNIWDVLAKLLLPVVALLALLAGRLGGHPLAAGHRGPRRLVAPDRDGGRARDDGQRTGRGALGAAADRGLRAVRAALRRPGSSALDLEDTASQLRATTLDLVRTRWPSSASASRATTYSKDCCCGWHWARSAPTHASWDRPRSRPASRSSGCCPWSW